MVPVVVASVDLGLGETSLDSARIPGSILVGKMENDGKVGIPMLQGEAVVVKVSLRDENGLTLSGTLKLQAVSGVLTVEWQGSDPRNPGKTTSSTGTHFGIDTSTVALWKFDSLPSGVVIDRSSHGRNLKAEEPGVWSRNSDTALTASVTGRILYETRVKLSHYPSSSLHNGRAVVVGYYEGLKLLVNDRGQLQAAAQRGDNSWSWFAPETQDSAVPLNRWVDLAVGTDESTGDVYAWINGKPVGIWMWYAVAGSKTRLARGSFMVGRDAVDGQKFDGLISEIRVSRQFVLGAGIPSGIDLCMEHTCQAPSASDTLVADWKMDSSSQSNLKDLTNHGFDLVRETNGVWSRANDAHLTPKITGQILYQAKVWLDRYPSSSSFNYCNVVVGFYEGLKLLVSNHGRVLAGAQQGNGNWSWYAPETQDSVVPLGKWTELPWVPTKQLERSTSGSTERPCKPGRA